MQKGFSHAWVLFQNQDLESLAPRLERSRTRVTLEASIEGSAALLVRVVAQRPKRQ